MRRRGVFPGQAGSQSDLSDSQCLKPRFQRIETDANGLRNAQDAYEKPIDVLLMGDSFTFGYGTNQPDIWSELLAERNVGNVYNMGVYGASPGEQVELLVYLLENNKIHMRNDGNVFFILFQGNDLTDSTPYNHENEITKIDLIKNYMRYIQSHTLLYKLYNIKRILEAKKYGYLLAKSDTLPSMVFTYSAGKYSEEETKKNFEKKQHEKAFKRLRDQVAKFNGKVFILYCPTKANAYTEYYNIPELLSRKYEDYFRGLIQDTCTEFGFKFIDLQPFIKRHADQGEVLFWTDDTHIDNKGHELLADIVQDSVKGE